MRIYIKIVTWNEYEKFEKKMRNIHLQYLPFNFIFFSFIKSNVIMFQQINHC